MRALLLALAALQGGPETDLARPSPTRGRFEVHVTREEDELLLTVRADEAPIDDLLRTMGHELGREVTGLERIGRRERVTVFLDQRPAESALHWIAGAAGMRVLSTRSHIQVLDDLPPFATRAEVFDVAELAYLRALSGHPQHAQAPAAWMAQARVQEARGNLRGAVEDYDFLVDHHHGSPLLPEAMMRSARHLASLDEWRAAASRLDELASLPYAHPYHVEARIELAEALCGIGDPQKAIFTLNALETYLHEQAPSAARDTTTDKVRRLVARARAYAMLLQAVEALRTLDLAELYDVRGEQADEILAVRALAFEQADRFGDAAVAWLKIAEEGPAERRAQALAQAARLGLESGDDVGVLFVHRYAEGRGLASATERWASTARARLGLETPSATPARHAILAEAEELLTRGETALAVRRFAGLYEQRDGLPAELVVRLARGYARALARDGMLDSAISALRGCVILLPDAPEDRLALYRLAADLFEDAGRFDDALEALRGRL